MSGAHQIHAQQGPPAPANVYSSAASGVRVPVLPAHHTTTSRVRARTHTVGPRGGNGARGAGEDVGDNARLSIRKGGSQQEFRLTSRKLLAPILDISTGAGAADRRADCIADCDARRR